MATVVEFSELIGQYVEDAFSPFPSSPEQCVALSSPSFDESDDIEYFSSFELKSHAVPKAEIHMLPTINTGASLKRKSSDASVPELPRKKQASIEQDLQFAWSADSPIFAQFQSQPNVAPSALTQRTPHNPSSSSSSSSSRPSISSFAVQPASITPSRIKSTTPNLKLLFSLFDVLENDAAEEIIPTNPFQQQQQQLCLSSNFGYSSSPSSPTSSLSPVSSPLSSSSRSPSPLPYYDEQNVIYINTKANFVAAAAEQERQGEEVSSPVSSPAHCVPEFDNAASANLLAFTNFGNNQALTAWIS